MTMTGPVVNEASAPPRSARLRLAPTYDDPKLEELRVRFEELRTIHGERAAVRDAARAALRAGEDQDRAAAATALRLGDKTPTKKAPALAGKLQAAEEELAVAALALGQQGDVIRQYGRDHRAELVAGAEKRRDEVTAEAYALLDRLEALGTALGAADALVRHLDQLGDGRAFALPRHPGEVSLPGANLRLDQLVGHLREWVASRGPKREVQEFSLGAGLPAADRIDAAGHTEAQQKRAHGLA